ncbi:MAG: hypothetical protein KTR31_05225 [Myxococcales bacterium]|nr:hypothetical protein [Myxococcales bacterium]
MFLLLWACASSQAQSIPAAEASPPALEDGLREPVGEPRLRVSGFALPSVAFDTDDGFGAGGRAELAWIGGGYEPYRTSLVLQAYTSTSGYHHHRFRFDHIGVGRNKRGRVTVRLAWRQWLNDGYWGIGNGTTRERAFVGTFDKDDPARKRYAYQLYQPFAHATFLHRLRHGGPWVAFLALSPRYSVVRTYPGSLLEEEQPYGIEGGFALMGYAGLIHDTRVPEIAPTRGHLVEVSGRMAPFLDGEAGGFGGALVSARAFAAPTERVVLAGRVMGEWLVGQVPFYEMVHWGGAIPVSGVGGWETIRGLSFGRLRAPGKAIANLEARVRVIDLNVMKRPVGLELAPYLDAGIVWDAEAPVPTDLPVHPAFGLGGRLLFDDTFVGRLDTGFGLDPIEEPDGTITQALTWGFYLSYDYPF